MQPLQRLQPQSQQQQQQKQLKSSANHLLHLQMPIESSTSFMESSSSSSGNMPGGNHHTGSCMDINTALNATANSSAPPSPLSISSVSSSASSTESTNAAPPSLGVNLRVTGQCSQGGRKYMEDFFSVAYQHSENAKDLEYAFFGIFDGHGGAEAATFAKEHLMMEIINQKLFWSDSDQDVLRAIREGYIATHFAMWREQDKWPKTANGLPSTAGTTATVAFIRHEKIYIGHVGDSGIVLGYQNEGEKCWRAKQLTIDHKPESIAERSRIMRSGGKVVVKSGVPRVVWNRPRNACHRGPIRHNTPVDEIPFLAVARSLGDLWSYNSMCNEFVVSPDPDVRVIKINPKTFRCLVFGTDGLWNVVTPQEAVHTVYQNEFFNEVLRTTAAPNETNWKNPSQSLVYKALNLWSAKKMRADNTSVVTVILHPPNGSCNLETSTDNLSNSSKLEASLSDCFGLEYTTQTHSIWEDAVTYREMAAKYTPPAEYQNFNYYDDGLMESNMIEHKNTFYEERYAKLSTPRSRFAMPTTIESLEFMCGDKEMEKVVAGAKSKKPNADFVESLKEIDIKLDNVTNMNDNNNDDDDDDDTDEEDCEDMCDDEDDEEDGDDDNVEDIVNGEIDRTHEHDDNTIVMPNNNDEYAAHFKELASTNSSSSSYMSTFAESYNTLLNGESDAQMSGEVSTSNSSNSYKSHCSTSMHELMQEQQRYQQQCMSEEEGYSLTKLETRREQQRCSAGVQTFRIFQQQQQQQQQQQELANDVSTQTNNSNNGDVEQQQQQSYMWQQAAQPLELNSLLQQEREEEQQVELERQMEIERLQQQQQHQTLEAYQNNASDFISSDDFHNADEEQPLAEHDITIDEEYLLDAVAADDATVQINEISSSSCLMDIETSTTTTTITPLLNKRRAAKKLAASPRISPMPSSSTSRESIYEDALESNSSLCNVDVVPKFIEKLEEIEILHEKPELVIETSSPSTTMMSTRSKHKAKILPTIAANATATTTTEVKRRATTRQYYRNVPNENQHQQQQQQLTENENITTKCITNSLLRLTSARTTDATTFFNKRQLRSGVCSNRKTFNLKPSTANGSSSSSGIGNSNSDSSNNSSTSPNSIDYAKRTLRTRNSLSKDLKAKASLGTSLKRTASSVTTRFLRTQAVSLLNMPQNTQVFVKKPNTATTAIATPKNQQQQPQQRQQQQQHQQAQLPLSAKTFNLINLRSRQIAGVSCQKTIVTLPSSASSTALQRPIAVNTTSQRAPNQTTTTTFVRRNLRTAYKSKLTATTSTTGLPNYCKSMRSQSAASLITPPPPSPKQLNGKTANITIAVTRARTTTSNIMLTPAAATPATTTAVTALNSLSNRKRNARHIVEHLNSNDNNSATHPRAPKRLKR